MDVLDLSPQPLKGRLAKAVIQNNDKATAVMSFTYVPLKIYV